MPKAEEIVAALLPWFARNARPLPWRRTDDPYAIWIAEIMLQQTQVQTVIPYWERWMRAIPDVQSLAGASFEKVLKLWEGLGYYSRARHLCLAARTIMKEHAGEFPREHARMLSLPGIGPYTAGAICSIAFDRPAPILDGNVTRVLTRLFGIGRNARTRRTSTQLWKLSERLVQTADQMRKRNVRACANFNQALMELGATICRPKSPDCPSCPVRRHCVARLTGRVSRFPNLGKRIPTTERREVAFIACCKGRFLVRQRPDGVVNAYLWEFPSAELNGSDGGLETLAHRCLGWFPPFLKPVGTVKHSITRYRVTVEAYLVELTSFPPTAHPKGRWCSLDHLEKLAFPSAHKRILRAIRTATEREPAGSGSIPGPCRPKPRGR